MPYIANTDGGDNLSLRIIVSQSLLYSASKTKNDTKPQISRARIIIMNNDEGLDVLSLKEVNSGINL